MNTKNTFKYIILALLVSYSATVFAQPENLNREVQVTRAYDPIISDANKIDVPINKPDSLTSVKKQFEYAILSRGITSTYNIRPLPAATISGKAYTDPHFLYARLGVGYPLSPLADIYINNYNPSGLSVGAYYNFRSIYGEIDNDNPNGFDMPIDEHSHNAGVFLRKHFDKFTLGVEGGFNQHKVLFYGYDTRVSDYIYYNPDKDSIAQTYNTFDIKLNLTSNIENADDFRYKAGIWFKRFGDNGKDKFNIGRLTAMHENTFGGELQLGKLFNDVHLFNIGVDFNYYNRKLKLNPDYYTVADTTDNRFRLVVLPSYTYAADKFEVSLGVKVDVANELDETKAYIRPKIDVAYIAADEFTAYAGIDGGRNVNTYEKIANENPYIYPGTNFNMSSTLSDYQIKFGAKGNIQKVFSYNAYAAYSLNKNMYFYHNLYIPVNQSSIYSVYNNFEVLPDEVQVWNVGLELAANFATVKSLLKANYYNYNMSDLKAPFHRPEFTLDFNTDVTIAQYFIVSASIYAQSKSAYSYYTPFDKVYYNDGFFDIGLGGEYLVNRNFSIFANVNNLLNKKYMKWNLYEVPGIHFEGGITIKF